MNQKQLTKQEDKKWLLLIIILGFVATLPLWKSGFYYTHDSFIHIVRIDSYLRALQEGQWPPQIAPGLYGNLGYPVFMLCYPLPYFLGAVLMYMGFSAVGAYKFLMGSSLLMSGVFMFWWLKNWWSPRSAAIATLIFMWTPYRLSVLYIRGAFGEALSYGFIPLMWWTLTRFWQRPTLTRGLIASLVMAALGLIHHLFSLLGLGVWMVTMIGISWSGKINRQKIIKLSGIVGLTCLLVSFLYFPFWGEKKWVIFDQVYTKDTINHLIALPQLIGKFGRVDYSQIVGTTNIMTELGGIKEGLLLLGAVLVLKTVKSNSFKIGRRRAVILTWLIAVGVLGLIIDSKISHYLWGNLIHFWSMDYPWRLLGLVNLSLVLTAAEITEMWLKNKWWFLVIMLILNSFGILVGGIKMELTPLMIREYDGIMALHNEYMPIWRGSWDTQKITGEVAVVNQPITAVVESSLVNKLSLNISLKQPGQVIVSRLYFPGWKAYVDDNPVMIKPSEVWKEQNNQKVDFSGLLSIDLPAGNHKLKVIFEPTKVRQWGQWLSGLGLILWIGGWGVVWLKRRSF